MRAMLVATVIHRAPVLRTTWNSLCGLLSMEAIANPPAYDRARAAVRYDDVARTLVQAFKYSDRLDLPR